MLHSFKLIYTQRIHSHTYSHDFCRLNRQNYLIPLVCTTPLHGINIIPQARGTWVLPCQNLKCENGFGTRKETLRRVLEKAWDTLKNLLIDAPGSLIGCGWGPARKQNKGYWKFEEGESLLCSGRNQSHGVIRKVENVPNDVADLA